ncbi:hypothetical protein [Thermoactinospora rubra]|uniref:hypothetical protein n=1 Tax=Thermoactinospora rubra TaxID=1088767 RepID=UPI000A0FEDEF|nr:hypothetical protein [Thermoactinospora rubra]
MIHPKPGQTLPKPLADLQETYKDTWSIWVSTASHGDRPRCYASRLVRDLSNAERRAGLDMTVGADTADELAVALITQTEIERRLAGGTA